VLDALVSRAAPAIPKELRKRLESMVENWCTQAFDDAFQPIQEYEIQCARERDLVVAEQSGDPRRVLEVLESGYGDGWRSGSGRLSCEASSLTIA
jgi:hypothetical protein